ncbi:MAG: hypothetical protein ACJA2Q_001799 [Pseudohongiellaceae bacterium]|jgi:hypothetical protein
MEGSEQRIHWCHPYSAACDTEQARAYWKSGNFPKGRIKEEEFIALSE